MVAVDTNVVVRLITGDHSAQTAKALRLVESKGIWISKTVILETCWVLRYHYEASVHEIARSVRALAEVDGVAFEAESSLISALDLTELNTDLEDALHLLFTDQDHLPFYTFDKDFFRKASRNGYAIYLVP